MICRLDYGYGGRFGQRISGLRSMQDDKRFFSSEAEEEEADENGAQHYYHSQNDCLAETMDLIQQRP